MQIISRKNFLLALAAGLVVALGIMAMSLSRRPKPESKFESEVQEIEEQSKSDEVDEIEEDLNDTDLSDVDKELQDIDREMNQSY